MRIASKGRDDDGSTGNRGGTLPQGIQSVHHLQFRVHRLAVESDCDLRGYKPKVKVKGSVKRFYSRNTAQGTNGESRLTPLGHPATNHRRGCWLFAFDEQLHANAMIKVFITELDTYQLL